MRECRDEFRRRGRAETRRRRLFEAVGGDAVETAAVVAAVEVEVLLDVRGQRPRVFDDLAVYVDDEERAVGSVGEKDGAEPVVARRDELAFLFVGGALGEERDAVGGADFFR